MSLFHKKTFKDLWRVFRKKNEVNQSCKNDKPRAIAFIDFENWYFSYKNIYHIKPDICGWKRKIEEDYYLEDIMVFADFSNKFIAEELEQIKKVTKTIIDVEARLYELYLKNETDFVMLNYIYSFLNEKPEIDTYIICTGDGHFKYAVEYLVKKLHKKVIVYGVKDTFSKQLKSVATEVIELPASDVVIKGIYPMIVENMVYVSDKPYITPTFLGISRVVASRNKIPEEIVRVAIEEMLQKELIYKKAITVGKNKEVKTIVANWNALAEVGLWQISD